MRFGITFKIAAFATLLVLITGASIGLYFYYQAGTIITEHELVDLQDETRLRGQRLLNVIDTLREDVLYLAGLKEIDALVRARSKPPKKNASGVLEPYDPMTQKFETELRNRLQTKFMKLCRQPTRAATGEAAGEAKLVSERNLGKASTFKHYFQVRFIGWYPQYDNDGMKIEKKGDEGREIVRIERIPQKLPDFGEQNISFKHVEGRKLDLDDKYVKFSEPYFKRAYEDAMQAKTDRKDPPVSLYLSEINLNREDGKISEPRMQALRAFVPILTDKNEFFGIVIVNLDFAAVVKTLRRNPRTIEYVLDEKGRFLAHPDPGIAFLWDQDSPPDETHPVVVKHDKKRENFLESLYVDTNPDEVPIRWREHDTRILLKTDRLLLGDSRTNEKPVRLADPFHLLTFRIDPETLENDAFKESFANPFQEFIDQYNKDPGTRDGGYDWRGRVRSSVNRGKGIVQISSIEKHDVDRIRALIAENFSKELSFTYETNCEKFAVQYIRFPYDPNDPNRYFDLAVAASYEEFNAEVDAAGRTILVAVISFIVAAGVIAFLFSRVLTKPLLQMTSAVDRFAEGSGEIELPVQERDEIGVLAKAFQKMFRQVRKHTNELRDVNQELQKLNAELDERVRERTDQLELKNEQLVVASRYKTDGLQGIAHELRAPLTGIQSAIKVLQSEIGGTLSEEKLKRVERIGRGCNHIQTLVSNLHQIARYESGRLELHKTEIDVRAFIEHTIGMLEESFVKRDIDIGCNLEGAPETIPADESRIRQVLINLLSNAEKYSPQGGSVTVVAEIVSVQLKNREEYERHLKISVSDTGFGIPKGDLHKVFEDFHRADHTREKAKGLGLGLALAKRLVEMHWGTIGIDSELGQGTTAWFTLPCEPVGSDSQLKFILPIDKTEA